MSHICIDEGGTLKCFQQFGILTLDTGTDWYKVKFCPFCGFTLDKERLDVPDPTANKVEPQTLGRWPTADDFPATRRETFARLDAIERRLERIEGRFGGRGTGKVVISGDGWRWVEWEESK